MNQDSNIKFGDVLKIEDMVVLKKINEDKQHILDEIKKISSSVDTLENMLKEKIVVKKTEIQSLERDYTKIIETYSHIVRELS